MIADMLDQFSDAVADKVAALAPSVVTIEAGTRHRIGLLWRPNVVVTSAQALPDVAAYVAIRAGDKVSATLAGRDPGTNVAVLRLAQPLTGTLPASAPPPRVQYRLSAVLSTMSHAAHVTLHCPARTSGSPSKAQMKNSSWRFAPVW